MNPIVIGLCTAVLIPVAAPLLMDLLACTAIALMNKTRGKPTWVKGTRFIRVVWPSGHEELSVVICAVTFRTVKLGLKGGCITIKKREMLKLLCVSGYK